MLGQLLSYHGCVHLLLSSIFCAPFHPVAFGRRSEVAPIQHLKDIIIVYRAIANWASMNTTGFPLSIFHKDQRLFAIFVHSINHIKEFGPLLYLSVEKFLNTTLT